MRGTPRLLDRTGSIGKGVFPGWTAIPKSSPRRLATVYPRLHDSLQSDLLRCNINRMKRRLLPLALALFLFETKICAQETTYYVVVASEAADKISIVRFSQAGAEIDHDVTTGIMPTDIDGPHGLTVSADKKYYYTSLAHGQPFGSVW